MTKREMSTGTRRDARKAGLLEPKRARPRRSGYLAIFFTALALLAGSVGLAGCSGGPKGSQAGESGAAGQSDADLRQEGADDSANGGALEGPREGKWVIQEGGGSRAGYRVRERLFRLPSPSEAIGATEKVRGELVVEGLSVKDVRVVADLRSLKSDELKRDNSLRERGLETAKYPEASFETTSPVVFEEMPPEGRWTTAAVEGRLTLHGVTRDITLEVSGRWKSEGGGVIEVSGNHEIVMADYGIEPPSIAGIVSVTDRGFMEFNLFFVPEGGR